MEIKPQSRLKFLGVEILSVQFHSEQSFQKNSEVPISLEIEPNVFFPKDRPSFFSIFMEVKIGVEKYFQLDLFASGGFEIEGEIDEAVKRSFVNANAPAIMFPYVRAFVATFTANLGGRINTITIPTHFFQGELPVLEDVEEIEA